MHSVTAGTSASRQGATSPRPDGAGQSYSEARRQRHPSSASPGSALSWVKAGHSGGRLFCSKTPDIEASVLRAHVSCSPWGALCPSLCWPDILTVRGRPSSCTLGLAGHTSQAHSPLSTWLKATQAGPTQTFATRAGRTTLEDVSLGCPENKAAREGSVPRGGEKAP